ncbi:urease accessory protein UreF [Bauldia sp.]|uniref:urease accessory protein UreF n=1 Tax=Bauldia sp. TaxID=2575872 RepID=UPI003BABDD6D
MTEPDEINGQVPDPAALVRLMTWLSPAFPVGAYTYSHGLEWAIEDGTVATADDLEGWLRDVLIHGGGRNDAILLVHAHQALAADDESALRDAAEIAVALQPSKERHLETTAQGNAFTQAVAAAWPNGRFEDAVASVGSPIAYPIAVAIAAAAHDVPAKLTVTAYLSAFVANIVSAGIRAIPIGQTAGQRTIAALLPACEQVAAEAIAADLDVLGGCALRADIASMKHETQYTRLFRS